MILVKIQTICVQPYRVEEGAGVAHAVGGEEVLQERHVLANSIGGALNDIARNPAKGAIFKVTVVDQDVNDPVYDRA